MQLQQDRAAPTTRTTVDATTINHDLAEPYLSGPARGLPRGPPGHAAADSGSADDGLHRRKKKSVWKHSDLNIACHNQMCKVNHPVFAGVCIGCGHWVRKADVPGYDKKPRIENVRFRMRC